MSKKDHIKFFGNCEVTVVNLKAYHGIKWFICNGII